MKKRCKLTKELFDLLGEMCDEITPYYLSNFRKKYSKRKTIETREINIIILKLFIASYIKNEDPGIATAVMNKYRAKLILYTSGIHTNNK